MTYIDTVRAEHGDAAAALAEAAMIEGARLATIAMQHGAMLATSAAADGSALARKAMNSGATYEICQECGEPLGRSGHLPNSKSMALVDKFLRIPNTNNVK